MNGLVIEQSPVLWTPAEVSGLRSRGKLWRVKVEIGRRCVRCKACGDKIPAGTVRLNAKHLNLDLRRYDLQGFVCVNSQDCADNILGNSVYAAQLGEYENHPEKFEQEQ